MKDTNIKTLEVYTYGEGDVLVDTIGMTDSQIRVLEVELEISEFETLEEITNIVERFKEFESVDDVFDYYTNERAMDERDAHYTSLAFIEEIN